MTERPEAPTLETLYAIYCETYAAVKSGQPTGFMVEPDLGRSCAKMLGANAASVNNVAPCTFNNFRKLISTHLDADWETRQPYGPPR